MSKQIFIAILLVAGFQQAFASAMSDELSKCLALRDLAKQHQSWKSEFHQFQSDDSLTPDEKFSLQKTTFDLVLKRLIRTQSLAGLDSDNRGLINDASRFLVTLNDSMITQSSASYLMTSALPKFEDALDDVFFRASIKNNTCDILPSSRNASPARASVNSVR